jgi:hypothetical protein
MLSVRVSGANPATGEMFSLIREIKNNYDSRSTLMLMAKAILGTDLNDDNAEVDYRQMVKGQFMGEVKSRDYHPKDESTGEPNEAVTHYWCEWRGAPLAIPSALRAMNDAALAQRREQPPPRSRGGDGDPGPEGPRDVSSAPAIKGSYITKAALDEVGPVIRRVLDGHFEGNDFSAMRAYFTSATVRALEAPLVKRADVILSFLVDGPDGRVGMSFSHRADPDMRDLGEALKVFEDRWKPEAGAGGDSDDLPF